MAELAYFPIQGGGGYSNDWGAPRSGDRSHQGNDIFAPKGTPVVAVVSGRVEVGTDRLGGKVVRLHGDDGSYYYYAHLDSQANVHGQRVEAGTVLGTVGTSGNATGTSPHLHFQIHPGGRGKPATNPYPFLQASEGKTAPGGGVSAAGGPGGEPMSFEERLHSQYGAFAVFLEIPELRGLIEQAVNEQWAPGQLQAALTTTEWWKGHSQTWRELEIQERTDPASFNQTLDARKQAVRDLASQFGVTIDDQRLTDIARTSLFYGWAPADLQRTVAYEGRYSATTTQGMAGVTVDQLTELAAQYLPFHLADDTINQWTTQILAGEVDVEAFTSYVKEQAKSLYPSLADAIDRGVSPRQYLDPYFQLAARELGINPNEIDWRDPKWSKPISRPASTSDKAGEWQAMDLWEWQREIRTNSVYGFDKSAFAAEMAAEFAQGIGEMFGRVA